MVKIVPTIGRVVHYFPSEADRLEGMEVHSDAPCTALVVYVWSDTCINLTVFDHDGCPWARRSVQINGPSSGEAGAVKPRAEWMAYQQGQAHKALRVAASRGE